MALLCTCPNATAIAKITDFTCPEDLGQIQKIIFQRLKTSAGVANEFASEPKLLAAWTTVLTAADSTKVVITPYINAPVAPAGAAITQGSGNEVLGGIPLVVGREATNFSCNIKGAPQSTTIVEMKKLQCEINNLGVYFVTQSGAIVMQLVGGKYRPFEAKSFFVGDKNMGGYSEMDMNNVQFSLLPNWSDTLVIVKPTDFNPLTDIVNS